MTMIWICMIVNIAMLLFVIIYGYFFYATEDK